MSRSRAFTLIEVLVSLTLMAFLLTTATFAFTQVKVTTARIQARQALHNTARIVYERLRFEIEGLQQAQACWLRSGGASGPVELVFMRGKFDNTDFTIEDGYGFYVIINTDLVWSRWHWDPALQTLFVASSSIRRQFQLGTSWVRGGVDYRDQWFAFLPEPRRTAGGDPTVRLNDNAFGTGSPEDYGDWTDLERRAVPIAVHCTDLRIEILSHDGTAFTASTDAANLLALDGVHVDGRASPAAARRPRLIRLRLELQDPRTRLTETFVFSFPAPAI